VHDAYLGGGYGVVRRSDALALPDGRTKAHWSTRLYRSCPGGLIDLIRQGRFGADGRRLLASAACRRLFAYSSELRLRPFGFKCASTGHPANDDDCVNDAT